ncbi:MAG: toprim domain-containing protein [Thermotogaceae bacterium]|nr:toprim domain-containing protein [Thermotogaceae bacterium]
MKKVKENLDLRELINEDLNTSKSIKSTQYTQYLCPFHDETNPSFTVYSDHYYCYGCGEHGDHLDWLTKYRKLSFEQAIRYLERVTGLNYEPNGGYNKIIKHNKVKNEAPKKQENFELSPEEIKEIVNKAHEELRNHIDKGFYREYFIKRGFNENLEELIEEFKLGACIYFTRENQRFSKFHDRLIIPFFDENGEIICFTARSLSNKQPKYLNTKGRKSFFNVQSKNVALDKGYILITEGAFDCLSVWYATDGTFPVIGIPGNGLNDDMKQFLGELIDYQVEILVLSDPDEGGEEIFNAIRNFVVNEKKGRCTRVYLITNENKPFDGDVNEALIEYGKDTLKEMIENLPEQNNPVGDLWYIEHLPMILEQRKKKPVYPTGLEEIDDMLEGGFREGLYIIGGITGAGKTSLALQIAKHSALNKRPVLYFTYELSKLEIWARVIAPIIGVNYFKIKDGKLTEEDYKRNGWDQVIEIAKYLKISEGDTGLINAMTKAYTVEEIEKLSKEVKERTGIAPLVIVDYLQIMPINEEFKKKDLREKIDIIITGLQARISRNVGSPVIALSSISRSSYSPQDDFVKRLGAFKESGNIEYTAFAVFLLYHDKEAEQNSEISNIVVDILKNREGRKLGQLKYQLVKKTNQWIFTGSEGDWNEG